ncbi:hypothetical protein VIBR0546_20600 [Vibrio brasiliensis LMG 20546]|uniref:Uncharacterized protein n=1 Tax=Vibrio brasiliensis LMG 20546 TaxID=945543 RepID=E8LZQ0_9VIBR|nr:hypothetical protein VIBR0546_20600 [Vibrio brasiliensis LMG 20546]
MHNATTGCTYMPGMEHLIKLGLHSSCAAAIAHARSSFPEIKINGCYFCCNSCHTT